MSSPHHDAPDNRKPTNTPTPELHPSKTSTHVSAATTGAPTPSTGQPTYMYPSQDFVPVGMTPSNINQFTNPIFSHQPPEANGLLSTSHLYAHEAPSPFQQNLSHPPSLSTNDEELLNRALHEVQQQLYQRQLVRDIDQNPQPSHVHTEYDQNHDAGHLVAYHSPTFQHPYSDEAAILSLQHAFAQEQREQQPAVKAHRQLTAPLLANDERVFDQYWRQQQESPIQYHHHHPAPSRIQHVAVEKQTEADPSRKRARSQSQERPSSEVRSLPVEEQSQKGPSQTRSRRDLQGLVISQSKQSEEEPSQKRPRRESQDELESQPTEQPRRDSNASPQRDTSIPAPMPDQSAPDAEPARQITVSATQFHNRAKTTLKTNTPTKYKDWAERRIAHDIADILMLSGIYLDSKSSVIESGAWLEWAFSMQGIWNRRPIANIPHAVPQYLLRKFQETYGNGSVVPRFDGSDRLVHGDGEGEGEEGISKE